MPEDMTQTERDLTAKVSVVREKTAGLKTGLAKKKNLMAAKKKDYVMRNIQPPDEVTGFLQSDDTWQSILERSEADKQDIIVRRYVFKFTYPSLQKKFPEKLCSN